MEKYKEILRYQKAGLSQRQTASVMGISRNTVAKVIQEASARQVTWEQVKTQTKADKLISIMSRHCFKKMNLKKYLQSSLYSRGFFMYLNMLDR